MLVNAGRMAEVEKKYMRDIQTVMRLAGGGQCYRRRSPPLSSESPHARIASERDEREISPALVRRSRVHESVRA